MTGRLDVLAELIKQQPKPLFITFEGGDGCGKSTQIKALAEELQARGANIEATFEPGASELGQSLRNLIQHGPEDVDPRTEALLYAADRAYHVANQVRPALESGTTVLSDRYIDSSVAYQGGARALGADEIRGLSNWATAGLQPDLTILFDVPAEIGLQRLGQRTDGLDRLERAGLAFHENVREQYLEMAQNEPERFRVVDATQDIPTVFEQTLTALIESLQQ